jgi:hypothetical protein
LFSKILNQEYLDLSSLSLFSSFCKISHNVAFFSIFCSGNSFIFLSNLLTIKTLDLFCGLQTSLAFTMNGLVDLYHNFSSSSIHQSKSCWNSLFKIAFTFSIIKTFGNLFLSIFFISCKILSISHNNQLLDCFSAFLEKPAFFHCCEIS